MTDLEKVKWQFDVLEKTIAKFGWRNQLDKLIEECAELIVSIQKLRFMPNGLSSGEVSEHLSSVVEEVEDVGIVMDQLRMHFGIARHLAVRDAKIARLVERYPDLEPSRIVRPGMRVVKPQ